MVITCICAVSLLWHSIQEMIKLAMQNTLPDLWKQLADVPYVTLFIFWGFSGLSGSVPSQFSSSSKVHHHHISIIISHIINHIISLCHKNSQYKFETPLEWLISINVSNVSDFLLFLYIPRQILSCTCPSYSSGVLLLTHWNFSFIFPINRVLGLLFHMVLLPCLPYGSLE